MATEPVTPPTGAPGGIAGWLGWILFVGVTIAAIIRDRRKGDVDEATLVLGKWKELVDAHEAAIKRLTEDFDRERTRWERENEALRKRVRDLEADNRAKDEKITKLQDDLRGLQRSIIQTSRSTAVRFAPPEDAPVMGANTPDENAAAIDRAAKGTK